MPDELEFSADAAPLTELIQMAADDRSAKDSLYHRVYDDLRTVAHRLMRKHRGNDLQTSALVNEVVIRFERGDALQTMANRRVFFSVATRAMNQILVDHFRRRKKNVDSPDRNALALNATVESIEKQVGCDFGCLNCALEKLEHASPRQHAVVMHRFFGGLSVASTADILDVSVGTVERDWRLAKAKLFQWIQEQDN